MTDLSRMLRVGGPPRGDVHTFLKSCPDTWKDFVETGDAEYDFLAVAMKPLWRRTRVCGRKEKGATIVF